MVEEHPRVTVGAVIVAIVAFLVFVVVFSGTQVSTILSTVGSSVGGVTHDETAAEPQPPAPPAGNGQLAAAIQPALLIVRTGTLTLQISSPGSLSSTVSTAADLVSAAGGFVAGSKEEGTAEDATATVDYRIPSTSWERTLAALRGLATVRAQEIGTEEVTGKVIDLGARITNLRATEAALQAIMTRATRIDDVLDVQKQLTDTRGEIEELSAQKAQLEDRAAFGSLTVAFRVPAAPTPAATPRPQPAWDPGKDVEEATGKLLRLGQRTTTAGIWFAILGLPILAALAVAIGAAWLVWRFVSRRRAATPSGAG